MATKTIVKFYSDLSGEEITSSSPTVKFSFGGKDYQLDLTESEHADLRSTLEPYIKAAKPKPGGSRRSSSGGTSPKTIRSWAVDQGLDVPARGRIPRQIIDAYRAAH